MIKLLKKYLSYGQKIPLTEINKTLLQNEVK